MGLTEGQKRTLDRSVSELRERLGERLEPLVLYGSAVRSDSGERISDLNLLILLRSPLLGPRHA
jgi:hypothetical protein